MAYRKDSTAKKVREILSEYLKDIPVGQSISSNDILHHLKCSGVDNIGGNLASIVREFGFKVERAGSASCYYRTYIPSDYIPEADENGHVPTLAERLNAQVADGERKEPNMYYNSTEETKPVGLNEVRDKLGLPQVDIGDAVGWAPNPQAVPVTFDIPVPNPQPSKPKYKFKEAIVSKELTGEYGKYKVFSDGQVIAELLVAATMSNEAFERLVDELDAVREEMEAIRDDG